jgi:hypothetical protein
LDALLTRYNKQFAAMDSLVGRVNAQYASEKRLALPTLIIYKVLNHFLQKL